MQEGITIEKRLKRAVHITANGGKLYTVNLHGVLCKRTPLDDGTKRNWYTHTLDTLTGSNADDRDFIESLAIRRDHRGYIFK